MKYPLNVLQKERTRCAQEQNADATAKQKEDKRLNNYQKLSWYALKETDIR